MTPQNQPKTEHTGILDSTVEFGAAVTKFAVDQLETAICAVSSPGKAIDRMKRSMDNITSAMNAPLETKGAAKEKEARKAAAPVETARRTETVREERTAEEEAEETTEAEGSVFNGRKT